MKLIDKSATKAEIERIKEMYCYDTKTNASFVAEAVINSINNAIDTLEVKEVEASRNYADIIAEIERRKLEEVEYDGNGGFASYADQVHYSCLDSFQDFIQSLP
jgi:hypothetical protein